jgi:Uri superfamily endonuclease
MDKGVYALILTNGECSIRIGALGIREFAAGWQVYVGSAQGSGGLARADRHIRLYRLKDRSPRWHIDHLLIDPGFTLFAVVCSATYRDCECDLAALIGGKSVAGFGCSDCACPSHLFYRPDNPVREVANAFRRLDLDARIKTIKSERSKDRV